MKKLIALSFICFLLSSCFGDKKSGIGTDFNDKSFVAKSFKNKVSFSEINSPCNYITKGTIAKMYNVAEKDVHLIGNQNSTACSIRVKMSDNEFDYITGSINIYEEKDKLEDGSSWIDSWQIQKGVSKSAKWIKGLGKAAMYKSKKRELIIKFTDYTMSVTAPGSAFNQIEKDKKRDYKSIVLKLAKQTPLLK
ncbi:hypothetical protein OD91_1576 [Lutibacter sp. Hel_I_33_5]|uniref:hypothetical protein n=1 Tax=Lutibacter sp. Hel_I_33_5 TaxID=1566289 RepID=UPI00119E06E7|nr:hypothetical protein [Lutibacter sp. Hel_I_33_5]TVZ56292.1 hypothetical protein OD91_1576 [Lutibacter sp. Hel_I_33_5]